MRHIESAFEVGEDINVQKLVSLYYKVEETVFTLMNLNEVNL